MPRAKKIVDQVVAKVKEEAPKVKAKKAAPKIEEPQITVEHYRACMTIVVPGSACNCPASVQK